MTRVILVNAASCGVVIGCLAVGQALIGSPASAQGRGSGTTLDDEPYRLGEIEAPYVSGRVATPRMVELSTARPNADELHFSLTGYARFRYNFIDNVPVRFPGTTAAVPRMANFGFGRVRLEPTVTFGSDPTAWAAALRLQVDILDNVVFGDNQRLSSVPVFAEMPSSTDVRGQAIDPVFVRRAWLEVMTPIGQVRVGRMASHGGNGILFNDGNGFRNEWGDARGGSTFDRVLFATRPLTIFNAITRGDRRPTPLIFAVAHDWLVQDPLGLATTPGTRSPLPFTWLVNGTQVVGESIFVLAWSEEPGSFRERATDEVAGGLYYIHRYQGSSNSNVHILDGFWRVRRSLWGANGPQLLTSGEVVTIQGYSQGVPLNLMSLDPMTGRTPLPINANIWGVVVSGGLAWDNMTATLEFGYSNGDTTTITEDPNRQLTQRALHPDYQVGLLLYPVMLHTATAITYTDTGRALWSQGGVWNSKYLNPQFRYSLSPNIDILAGMVFAYADVLNEPLAAPDGSRGCDIVDGACFLGWEADVALKVRWGGPNNDQLRWSTEFGYGEAGPALAPRLPSATMWTLQSRLAFVF